MATSSKGGSALPAIPDPVAVANAQGAANRETAIAQARLNQINEITPYGSSTYAPTGQKVDGIDMYQRTVELSPAQQAILDKQNALTNSLYGLGSGQIGRITDAVAQPFNYEGLPGAPTSDDAARQQAQDSIYARYAQYLDPRFSTERTQLENKLAGQGFSTGSAGYKNALDEFDLRQRGAYSDAANAAITGGGQEMQLQYGLDEASRNSAIQERLAARNQPINELAAILGSSAGVTTPQFSGIPQTGIAGTDTSGAVYQSYNAAMNQYNAQQQQNQGMLSGLFGLGSSILGALPWSDPAMKLDVLPVDNDEVLAAVRAMPVPSWRYRGDETRRIGVMADDFARSFGGDGHMLDVVTALGVCMASIKALADRLDRMEGR